MNKTHIKSFLLIITLIAMANAKAIGKVLLLRNFVNPSDFEVIISFFTVVFILLVISILLIGLILLDYRK